MKLLQWERYGFFIWCLENLEFSIRNKTNVREMEGVDHFRRVSLFTWPSPDPDTRKNCFNGQPGKLPHSSQLASMRVNSLKSRGNVNTVTLFHNRKWSHLTHVELRLFMSLSQEIKSLFSHFMGVVPQLQTVCFSVFQHWSSFSIQDAHPYLWAPHRRRETQASCLMFCPITEAGHPES